MRLHPGIGARIVSGIPFLEDTIQLIECHQERWDGSGYPFGYKGEEIPELARLFSVIDAFDALTSTRPYRKKISKEEAIEYLKEQAGISFDPAMVEAFEKMMKDHPKIMDEFE
jgi:HD-GYP domain-containing protein (c-di-GMP phosphodiesterase class II)